MPKEDSTHRTRSYDHLISNKKDAVAYPDFLGKRAEDYAKNAKRLYDEAVMEHSKGHIRESNDLLNEAIEVGRESIEYTKKLEEHTHEHSRELRRKSILDAEATALKLQERIRIEERESINRCTPIKIIKEHINMLFIELTGYPIFDSAGNSQATLNYTSKSIIGELLNGFDKLNQPGIKENKLLTCKNTIAEKSRDCVNNIEDRLVDYFRDSQLRKKSTTQSLSRARSLSTALTNSTKYLVKSGKEKTPIDSFIQVTTNIASQLGWDIGGSSNYFPDTWLDATTSVEVNEKFISFCNNFLNGTGNKGRVNNSITTLYHEVKSHATDCDEVLQFVIHNNSKKLGGKSRKRNKRKRNKRKSQKNKNK